MALMTFFKAELQCPQCGKTSIASIQSQLGDSGKTYEVGDRYDDDIIASDFDETSFVVKQPKDTEAIHVLMPWTCSKCRKANFVEVVFSDGTVTWIGVVDLDPELLDGLHYISQLAESMLRPIIGVSAMYTDAGLMPEWLPRLRAGLEAGRRWPGPADDDAS